MSASTGGSNPAHQRHLQAKLDNILTRLIGDDQLRQADLIEYHLHGEASRLWEAVHQRVARLRQPLDVILAFPQVQVQMSFTGNGAGALVHLAALAMVQRLSDFLPLHPHDCPSCVPLGRMPRQPSCAWGKVPVTAPEVDLYYCRRPGLADYLRVSACCGGETALHGSYRHRLTDADEPHLTEGHRRAVARNLIFR